MTLSLLLPNLTYVDLYSKLQSVLDSYPPEWPTGISTSAYPNMNSLLYHSCLNTCDRLPEFPVLLRGVIVKLIGSKSAVLSVPFLYLHIHIIFPRGSSHLWHPSCCIQCNWSKKKLTEFFFFLIICIVPSTMLSFGNMNWMEGFC